MLPACSALTCCNVQAVSNTSVTAPITVKYMATLPPCAVIPEPPTWMSGTPPGAEIFAGNRIRAATGYAAADVETVATV